MRALRQPIHHLSTSFADAWKARRQNDAPIRLAHELAFLPANLELMDTPVHPAPQLTVRILSMLVLIVVFVALIGQLDIVAVAPGKLIPIANVKIVQPAITGVVRSINVTDGQKVKLGDVLVELDPTQAGADVDHAKAMRQDALFTIARAQALLEAEKKGSPPILPPLVELGHDKQLQGQRLVEGAYREYQEKMASLAAELKKRRAELEATRAEIRKLEQTAPLARQLADDYHGLAADRYVSNHDYLGKEQTAIEQVQELAAQRSHALQLEAGLEQQQHDIDTTTATFRREQMEDITKASALAEESADDETKATSRQGLTRLTAPVSGTVQQLSIHTTGGVVSSAQTLMEIVPDDSLAVEVNISNQDIGFVSTGQDVVLKIATFPYTRFGYLKGKVSRVSNDSTQDKKQGLVFRSRVSISSNQFRVNDKWINLSPGMEVTAEINTGRQFVWQYFLSPLLQTSNESLRER